MSNKIELSENPLGIVHEVLRDWLEENEPTDFDENDVAHLFGMLGTAGYSIVPNVDEAKLAQLNADVLHNLNNGPVWVEAGVSWVQRSRVVSVLEALTRGGSEVLAKLRASETKVRELTEQLTPGSMTERAPTQWAYEKSCAAVEKHRKRADAAEAQVAKVYEILDKDFDQYSKDKASNCTPQQAQFYQTCEGALAMLRMHLEKEVPEPKPAAKAEPLQPETFAADARQWEEGGQYGG